MTDAPTLERKTLSVAGAELELLDGGQGAPVLFLHSASGIEAGDPFLRLLARQRRVIAPSHPGFGRSALPDWMDSVDDFAHVYLEMMDKLKLTRVDMIGCSIGGWIANEIATKAPERINRLVLIGPVGVKVGPVDKLDIPDMFAMPQEKVAKLIFHDPVKYRPDLAAMSDEQVSIMVRNRETLALITWEPYMHNPKLKHRLHRVTAPTLFVRGASDGLISAEYLQKYAALLPNARTETIAEAGHAPQLEQSAVTADKVIAFLNG